MTTPARIRILTVDDHPLLLEGLAAVIQSQPDMVLVGQALNCRDAIQQFRKVQPDVTMMDLRLPDMSGIEAMMAIQAQFPDARIIIMTTFEGDGPVQHALRLALVPTFLRICRPERSRTSSGKFMLANKRVPAEIAATMAEHLGDEQLTDREVDVLRQTAGGNRNRDIADRLFIAEETVKAHMKHIMEKLGASDRTHAVYDRRPARHYSTIARFRERLPTNRSILWPRQCRNKAGSCELTLQPWLQQIRRCPFSIGRERPWFR